MRYVVLYGDCIPDLEKEVNEALRDGATLQGGVSVGYSVNNSDHYSCWTYAQAVTYPE